MPTLELFEGFGIELEYMLVDAASLDVRPIADWLLERAAGELTDEYEHGSLAWNNELVLHVIELKTNGPARSLDGLGELFQREIRCVNEMLAERGVQLMPTAMHPWMDPAREKRLWPHGNREVYATFDKIFDCRGHGWSNLQSMHVNLPFSDDEEFARLHAAIRLILPIIPGLAAASPIIDGAATGRLDNRLAAYRNNCARIPSVTAQVIPEPVYRIENYREQILEPMYRDIAPHDPGNHLRHEWLNARGAIARFERMAIEIRLIDIQECPAADLAVARLVSETVRALTEEQWISLGELSDWPMASLKALLDRHIETAEQTVIETPSYLKGLGLTNSSGVTCAGVWEHLAEWLAARGRLDKQTEHFAEHYLRHGTLARRILNAWQPGTETQLHALYSRLVSCLASGELFGPHSVP